MKNLVIVDRYLKTECIDANKLIRSFNPEEDRAITRGLMRLSERVLTRVFENEPDIYTVEDLKD